MCVSVIKEPHKTKLKKQSEIKEKFEREEYERLKAKFENN